MKRSRMGIFLLGCFLLGACAKEEQILVDIFYTADVQGFYYSRPEPRFENRTAGGYGILQSFLARQENPYLLFDGGNWYGSAPEANLTQGAYVADFMKVLPYTAASVSGPDFAYGWPVLRGLLRELKYPFIVSNLRLDNQIPWPLHDYQIFTRNGIKIGVFGLVGPEIFQKQKTRLAGLSVEDPIQTATDMVALLQNKGVDVIILLNALGEDTSNTPAEALLAGEVGGIHLILSANKDREMAETDTINNTFIVYPGAKLDSLSHIRLEFDKAKQIKNITFEDVPLLQDQWAEDEVLARRAAHLRQETQRKLNARVTRTESGVSTALNQESVLGDLLADCLYKWSRLDGAVLNSDSIRSSLPKGVVTEYDLYQMYPYGDNITFLTMRGSAFLKALEASLEAKDNFPQIAGFDVTYNPQAPAGHKIKQIHFLKKNKMFHPQDTYRIAVTDHVLAGGFGHDYFVDSLEFKNTFVNARQIMRACLIRQKHVALPRPGRWTVAHDAD